jgi:hypothetical protein
MSVSGNVKTETDRWFDRRPKDLWYVLTRRVDEDGDTVVNYRGGMDKATAVYVAGQDPENIVLGFGTPFVGMG